MGTNADGDALTLEIERRITAAKATRFHTLLALADAYAETAPESEERSVARMAFAVELGRERDTPIGNGTTKRINAVTGGGTPWMP